MNDKKSIKTYKAHNEPQSSYCLVVHEDAHLSYKIQSWEILFQRPSKVHKYQYTQTHIIFVSFKIFLFLLEEKKNQKLDWLKPQQPSMHEIKKVSESLGIFFLLDRRLGWRTFLLHKPLFRWIRIGVESIEIWE